MHAELLSCYGDWVDCRWLTYHEQLRCKQKVYTTLLHECNAGRELLSFPELKAVVHFLGLDDDCLLLVLEDACHNGFLRLYRGFPQRWEWMRSHKDMRRGLPLQSSITWEDTANIYIVVT